MAEKVDFKDMTAEQWTTLIRGVLERRDVEGVALLIRAMAIYHPHEAEDLRQTILLGASIAADRGQ